MDNRIIHPDHSLQTHGLDEHLCFYLTRSRAAHGSSMPSQTHTLAYFSMRMALTDLLTFNLDLLDPVIGKRRKEGYHEYCAVHGGHHEPEYGRVRCHNPQHICIQGDFGIYFTSEYTLDQLKGFSDIPFTYSPYQGHPYSLQLARYAGNFERLEPTSHYALLQEWASQYYAAGARAGRDLDFELLLKRQAREGKYADQTIHHYFTHPRAALQTLLSQEIGCFDDQGASNTELQYTAALLVNDKKKVSASVITIPIEGASVQTPAGIYLKAPDGLGAIAGTRPLDIATMLGTSPGQTLYKMGSYQYGDSLSLQGADTPPGLNDLSAVGASQAAPQTVYTLRCNYHYNDSYTRGISEAQDVYHHSSMAQALYHLIHLDLQMWQCLDRVEALPLQLSAAGIEGPWGQAATLAEGARGKDGARTLSVIISEKAAAELGEATAVLQRNAKDAELVSAVPGSLVVPIARRYDTLGVRLFVDVIATLDRVLSRQVAAGKVAAVASPREVQQVPPPAEKTRRWLVQMIWTDRSGALDAQPAVFSLSTSELAHQFILSLPGELFQPEVTDEAARYLQKVNLIDRLGGGLVSSRYYVPSGDAAWPQGFYLEYNRHSLHAQILKPDAAAAIPHDVGTYQSVQVFRQRTEATATHHAAHRRTIAAAPPDKQRRRKPK